MGNKDFCVVMEKRGLVFQDKPLKRCFDNTNQREMWIRAMIKKGFKLNFRFKKSRTSVEIASGKELLFSAFGLDKKR